MKGIDLFMVLVIVLVISVVAFTSFSLVSGTTLRDACRDSVTQKVVGWAQKMSFSTATNVEDEILLPKDCVEYVGQNGIKFKGEDKEYVFSRGNEKIIFQFVGTKILPRDVPYKVLLKPPNTIQFEDVGT